MIRENIETVRENIKKAAQRAGRNPDDILLIGVTKTKPVEMMQEAIDEGITDIGENRVQEIMEKYEHIKGDPKWHLIGHLQTNKVKYIIDKVDLIHSVESISLAEEINKRAEKIGKVQKVLLEVNVSGEESKFGISPENIMEFCEKIAGFKNIRVSGLMTVAPFTEDEKILRKVFSDLRKISLDISTKFYDTIYMEELSMGMTNDYEIAIEEGATMVRVGTGIFGNR